VIVSWWILALIAVLAAIPVWWLEEMDGFSSVAEELEGDVISYADSTDLDEEAHLSQAVVSKDNDDGVNSDLLHIRKVRSTTGSGGERIITDEDGEVINEGSPLLPPQDQHNQRSYSQSRQQLGSPAGEPRIDDDSAAGLRRMPSPIGLGPGIGGRSRRYSSEIGATRSGWGTGGTSYH
jgi:hypothetical protein